MFNKLLSLVVMALITPHIGLSVFAQRSYTFNATSLNVDGLPRKILGITTNPDGRESEGATAIGNRVRTTGWDITAMSEDFNFHSDLVAPLSDLYYVGTHGGKVSTLTNSTDGLGLLVTKKLGWSFSNETRVKWNEHYGETNHGADGLINKGFRYYTITIAPGVEIDFYCLHMDAEDDQGDIDARASQMKQLASYIKGTNNGRHILILGDTNCRYTRDKVKELLIDGINADARFTIHDAWIELVRNGVYPKLGDGAIMTSAEGPQRGEVVDKVFWIENSESPLKIKANSYLHDTSFTESDHFPLTVNFTITDPTATPATKADYTLPESATAVAQEIEGCSAEEVAASGETFCLMNLSTRKYLQAGANWATRAVEATSAMPLTLTLVDGKYRINTIQGSVSAEATPYMDNGGNTTWTFEQVEGKNYQYIIRCDDGALASTGTDNIVNSVGYKPSDDKQKWVLLTDAKLKEVMREQATAAEPFNITPLIKGADFGKMMAWNNAATYKPYITQWWTSSVTPSFYYTELNATTGNQSAMMYDYSEGISATQSLGTLAKGKYVVSFNGCQRERSAKLNLSSSVNDHSRASYLAFNSFQVGIPNDNNITSAQSASELFANGSYLVKSDVISLESDTEVKLELYMEAAKEKYKRSCLLAVANMELLYYGDGDDADIDPYIKYKNAVAKKVNETWTKVEQLNADGQTVYDISNVISRYNTNNIKSDDDVAALCAQVDAAYKLALITSLNSDPSGDMTALITNASFENGDLTGWTSGGGYDVGVKENANGTYSATGCDGDYLFNSYNGDDATSSPYVVQTISGVKNGLYEVKAKLTSFAGRSVFLLGGNSHVAIKAQDKTKFEDASLRFIVEDGTLKIGAVGGSGTNFDLYMPTQGCFFKADDFSVKYISNVANGRISLAIADAKAQYATLADDKGSLDLSAYEQGVANSAYTGDGKTETNEIYALLAESVKAQRTIDADMTYAMVNPNFETGDMTGWVCPAASDTKVVPQDNATYTALGTDGSYLFNTWGDGSVTLQPLTQTVSGLYNGQYQLQCLLASDPGSITLTANNKSVSIATIGKETMVEASLQFDVRDGKANISVLGDNNLWFKADNFRLTYLGNKIELGETDTETMAQTDFYHSVIVNRTINPGKWNTFVVPFDMEIPEGWTVKQLANDTYVDNNDVLHLRFASATAIEAGKPCMVMVGEKVTKIEKQNIDVDMKTPEQTEGIVSFVGTYTSGNVPTAAFFISNNQFYYATDATNTIKGYRAYLQVSPETNAKAVDFSISDTPTSISAFDASASSQIYDLQGNRLTTTKKGINIVKIANGCVRKVIVR